MSTDHLRSGLVAFLVLSLATGCPAAEPPGETDDPSGGSTDAGGGSTGTTPGDTPTSSSGQSSGESSGQGSGDTSADSSGDGGPGSELEQACEATCDVAVLCFPETLPEDCVEFCLEDLPETDDPSCTDALVQLYECFGSLTCEEAMGEQPCPEQEAAVDEICGTNECFFVVGGVSGMDGPCEYQFTCADLTQEMNCTAEGCTCLENGVEIGSCDPMGTCEVEDPNVIVEYAIECCGFVDPLALE